MDSQTPWGCQDDDATSNEGDCSCERQWSEQEPDTGTWTEDGTTLSTVSDTNGEDNAEFSVSDCPELTRQLSLQRIDDDTGDTETFFLTNK